MNGDNQIHDMVYVYEGAQARMERANKRLWVVVLVLIAALLLTNIGWIVYEAQFETVTEETVRTTVEQENEGGNNNFIGGNGDIVNGEATDNND